MAEETEGSSREHLANFVDDLYLSALFAEEDLHPASGEKHLPLPESGEKISSFLEDLHPASDQKHPALLESGEKISPLLDENYASLLQFQEVLVSSATATAAPGDSSPCPHQVGQYCYPVASTSTETIVMAGEPSNKRIFCDICAEAKPLSEMFQNPSCNHTFCKECVRRHISANVQENITVVKCLAVECRGALEPELCREIVAAEVFDQWGTALCKLMLLGWRTFYCPFEDCSAPLVDDGEEAVLESECPHCHRLFCAQCGVPWHAGVECEEFQRLGADERGGQDLVLLDLAKRKNWKRCPSCRFYVEKGEGCLHITCRCGIQFCYGCGSTWSDAHASCHT